MKHAKEAKNIKDTKRLKRKNFIFIIIGVILLGIIACVANNYIIVGKNKMTNLVINNRNVTENLKKDILIENGEIYISKQDLGNFFDKYIYEDQETEQVITTYNKKIAEISFDKNVVTINGVEKTTYAHAIKKDDTVYLPISELKDVYDIEINNIESTKVLVIDSLSKEQKKAVLNSNQSVKSSKKFIAKTVDRVKKGECVIVISNENGYAKIRTEEGKIGYVKSNKLANEVVARQDMEEEKQIQGKVNLVWDYYSQVANAPDRTDTKIDGVNVVSPSFFSIDKNGKLVENVGERGQAYLEWARDNNCKIWPMVQNAGDSTMMDTTSKIMNSYEKRKVLIESIVNVCIKYKLDGINIDFENMRKDDKDLYSRFIIELEPRMKELGLVLSVDVTAPDGSDTWSLCFDRHVIGDVADYIIFMAYDEYGESSTKSGTTAGYDWVELGIKKFLETEEVEPEKLILAVPLYTRLWTEDSAGKVIKKSVVSMKDIDSTIPSDVERKWDDKLKQYYVEYNDGNNLKKMWIEDVKSLKEKVSLITNYKLGGVASWEKGMETDEVWKLFQEALK
jgi:putative glycoside hydrolase family protein